MPTGPADGGVMGCRATAEFGFDLLGGGSPPTNLVVAPASVWLALAMATAGAAGSTADQMAAGLRLDPGGSGDGAAAALRHSFERHAQSGNVTLDVANGLWGDRTLHFRRRFLDVVEGEFAATVRLVDFVNDPEGARHAVNLWAAQLTRDMISELVPPGLVRRDTRLVVANAVYLLAEWTSSFPREASVGRPFHATAGDVEVPFMHQVAVFGYARVGAWQALELSYKGDELAMVVVLGDQPGAWPNSGQMTSLVAALKPRQVALALPRFRLQSALELSSVLAAMGMVDAFGGGQPDFSAMAEESLRIDSVIHQAVVDVDERGTEAAAATALVTRGMAAPSPEQPMVLEFDRPFTFMVRDRPTEAVLLLGRVVDPTTKG